MTSLSSACTGPCDIDVRSLRDLSPGATLSFIPCDSTSCAFYYNTDGFYVHETGPAYDGTKTPFTRQLTFAPFSNASGVTELEVTSSVSWTEGRSTQMVSMNESLFDYYATH